MNFCRDLHSGYCSYGYLAPTREVRMSLAGCRAPSAPQPRGSSSCPVTAELRLHHVVLLGPFAGLASQ